MIPGNGVCLSINADVVYFLMFDGWEQELRSNRWHYARRWARHLPVVLVQPRQSIPPPRLVSRPEARIEGCRILHLKSSNYLPSYMTDSVVQLGQIAMDMEEHGFKRPLLWLYNPLLLGLYAMLPSVARVIHATDNYFHFEEPMGWFLDRYAAAISISDVVFAVSEGVGTSLRQHVPGARIEIVSNGCDYTAYAAATASNELFHARGRHDRIAIYAGNINNRLDYELLQRCVRDDCDTLFAFFGPVVRLSREDRGRWKALLREPNVRYFGPVDPDQLPGLYRAADVGIIPYRQTRVLVENGFPLKALEMCATGLPVVATLMKPIVELTLGLVVAHDHDEFAKALSRTSRGTLSEAEREDMRRVCEQHDYDNKFTHVIATLAKEISGPREPATRVDAIVPTVAAQWRAMGISEWQRAYETRIVRVIRRWLGNVVAWLYMKIPGPLRRLFPTDVKRRWRRRLLG